MADEKQNIQDTTVSGKKRKTIYAILIAIAIYGLVSASSKADWFATLFSGWGQ